MTATATTQPEPKPEFEQELKDIQQQMLDTSRCGMLYRLCDHAVTFAEKIHDAIREVSEAEEFTRIVKITPFDASGHLTLIGQNAELVYQCNPTTLRWKNA